MIVATNEYQGCGIVEYEDTRGANRAIRELNNTTLGGRPIFVREDREQASARQGRRGGGGGGGQSNSGGGGGGGGGANIAGRQLYVGNLSFETTWADLKVRELLVYFVVSFVGAYGSNDALRRS